MLIVYVVLSVLCAVSGGVAIVGYILRRRFPADLTRDLLAIGGPSGVLTSAFMAIQVVETSGGVTSLASMILGGLLAIVVALTIIASKVAVDYCAK